MGTNKWYYEHVKMIQKRLAGERFSVLLRTFSLHVFFLNIFLFLVCPYWSGVGYDFRGNELRECMNVFMVSIPNDFKKSFLLLL